MDAPGGLGFAWGHVRNATAAFLAAEDPTSEYLFLAAECLDLEGLFTELGVAPEFVDEGLDAATITSFADNSRHSSAWAQDCYQRARSRGARHPHAIRILARGWVRVIWACWTTDIAYDPTRHHAEQQLATRT